MPRTSRRNAPSFRPSIETLEARNLLSAYTGSSLTDNTGVGSIYWTEVLFGNAIRRANLDGTNQQTLLTGLNAPAGIALDVAGGKMYWADFSSGALRRANLDGTDQQTLVSGLNPGPNGLALDLANGTMYWDDSSPGVGDIRRANLDGTNQQTLVSGLNDPGFIALDIAGGKVYWTDQIFMSGDVRRANLDGTDQQILATGNLPGGIALDTAGGRMYWTDLLNGNIHRANLDGTNQQTLLTGLDRPDGIALDVAAGKMYWTDEDFQVGDIRRANLDGTDQEILVTGLTWADGIALQLPAAPTVTCTVADALLWPPNHRLVNVGLGVNADPPDASLHIAVYGNDNASPADAADIGPGTLQLRSERQGNGTGRVYLVVVTATDAGGSSSDVCTVAVPHDQSARSIASVEQQAAAAEAYYQEFQAAPPGYDLLGEGPDDGTGAPSSGQTGKSAIPGDLFRLASPLSATSQPPLGPASVTATASPPADEMLGAWAELPVDKYFATASAEGFRFLVARPAPMCRDVLSGAALDLLPGDDQL